MSTYSTFQDKQHLTAPLVRSEELGEDEEDASPFRPHQRVFWNDPEGLCSGWGTVVCCTHPEVISINKDDGGEVEAFITELSERAP